MSVGDPRGRGTPPETTGPPKDEREAPKERGNPRERGPPQVMRTPAVDCKPPRAIGYPLGQWAPLSDGEPPWARGTPPPQAMELPRKKGMTQPHPCSTESPKEMWTPPSKGARVPPQGPPILGHVTPWVHRGDPEHLGTPPNIEKPLLEWENMLWDPPQDTEGAGSPHSPLRAAAGITRDIFGRDVLLWLMAGSSRWSWTGGHSIGDPPRPPADHPEPLQIALSPPYPTEGDDVESVLAAVNGGQEMGFSPVRAVELELPQGGPGRTQRGFRWWGDMRGHM